MCIGEAAQKASSDLAKERNEVTSLHRKIGDLEKENCNLLKRIAFIHDVSPETVFILTFLFNKTVWLSALCRQQKCIYSLFTMFFVVSGHGTPWRPYVYGDAGYLIMAYRCDHEIVLCENKFYDAVTAAVQLPRLTGGRRVFQIL